MTNNNNNVLWIENQLDYSMNQINMLRDAGYKVRTASTAEIGYEILSKAPDSYNVIILDILLGEKPIEAIEIQNGRSGLVLHKLIRDKLHINTPIIFVTVIVDNSIVSYITKEEENRGLIPHILHKPVRPSELLDLINKIIHK